jgi:hypothetical protein
MKTLLPLGVAPAKAMSAGGLQSTRVHCEAEASIVELSASLK